MPRRSSEAIAAEAFLGPAPALPVPKGLQPMRARQIWEQVVGSKPGGYFLARDEPLLRRFCVLCSRAEQLEQLMVTTPVDAKEAPRIERRLVAITAALTGLAQKTRLTAANRIEAHSTQRSEQRSWPAPWLYPGGRGARKPRMDLLGGDAVHKQGAPEQ